MLVAGLLLREELLDLKASKHMSPSAAASSSSLATLVLITNSLPSHHKCSLCILCAQEVLNFVKQRSAPKTPPAAATAAPAAAAAPATPARPPAKMPKLVQGGVTLIFSEEEFDAGGWWAWRVCSCGRAQGNSQECRCCSSWFAVLAGVPLVTAV